MSTDLPTLALAVRGRSNAAIRAVVLGALGSGTSELAILGVLPDARILTVDEQPWRLTARAGDVFGAYPRAVWSSRVAAPHMASLGYVGKADLLVITDVVGREGALKECQPWLPRLRAGAYVWIDGAAEYADSLGRTIVAAGKLLPGPVADGGAWIGKVPRDA